MAKKTKKSAENIAAQTAAPADETTPTVTPKLIVAQRKFNRWYDMVWMEKLIGEHGANPKRPF